MSLSLSACCTGNFQNLPGFSFDKIWGIQCAGDCVVASSFVSYLGPFNKEFRELLFTCDFQASLQKLSIPASPSLSVTTFLADLPEIGQWNLQVAKLMD